MATGSSDLAMTDKDHHAVSVKLHTKDSEDLFFFKHNVAFLYLHS